MSLVIETFPKFASVILCFLGFPSDFQPKPFENWLHLHMLNIQHILFWKHFVRMKIEYTPEVFLEKDVLKLCSKFAGEHPCQSATSVKLLCNFALWHGCSPVNLLDIFRIPFPKNTSGGFFWTCYMYLKYEIYFQRSLF